MIKRAIKGVLQRVAPRSIIAWKNAGAGRCAAITFDDGPHPEFTPPILDVLARHDCRATFFVLGCNVEANPTLARRMVDDGHELGNHSFTHNGYTNGPLANPSDEINRTNALVAEVTGVRMKLYRPPYGALSLPSIFHCMREGMTTVMWSVDSTDYLKPVPAVIDENCSAHLPYSGDIILFHDHNENTVEALDRVLIRARSSGTSFRTAGELIGRRRPEPNRT